MIISHIVAIGSQNQIGLDNKLLWHIPNDFKQFKKRTMGHHLLMGRKTFESIGRPLPGRTTIVVSKAGKLSQEFENTFVVTTIEEAIELAASRNETELFICGGESIYRQTLNLASKIYLTKVDYHGPADCFYPSFNQKLFNIVASENHQQLEAIPSWSLLELVRM